MLREDILKSLPQSRASTITEIFDAIPLQIVIKSLREDNFGEFLVWNKEAEKVLGIFSSEALGCKDENFFPPEQVESFARNDRELARSGRPLLIPAETIVSRTLGLRTLKTAKTPIYDEAGQPVALLAISEDITEKRSTEFELQKALNFLNNINSQLPGAVFQFSVDGQGRASFPYISEGINQITGNDAHEVVNGSQNLLIQILPDDLPAFLAGVARSRREMSHCRQEFRMRTRVGDIRWVMTNSLPKSQDDGITIWHGFITDITQLKEASEALRRGEDRLHSALDAMDAAVWEINVETGEVYLSPEWGRVFGFAPEHFPRTFEGLLEVFHPDDQEICDQIRRNGGAAGLGQLQFRHRCADGSYLWTQMSGKAIRDADGHLIRQVGTVMDISERKKIEIQLIEAKEHAEHANNAKGDFLAMMSHEIRTPLNAVLGFSELLSSTALGREQAEFLRTIQDNSSALLVVLNDVLDYSKIESGKLDMALEPVSLSKIISSAVEVFRPQAAAKGVEISVVSSDDIPELLLCDSARLSQIIHNLLSNSVKFTERGSIRVDVLTSRVGADGIWPVRIKVSDTGIGIHPERHEFLFEPFYQADISTRRRYGGTGLGLTIVKKLVDLMNGRIDVASTLHAGTTFTVSLPLAEPEKADFSMRANAGGEEIELSEIPKDILIVEDNRTNRNLLKLFLKKLHFDADEAENGFEGVERAARKNYAIIFMDLEMPGMDGYEATRLIRKMPWQPTPYIIAVTAHAMPEHRKRSFEAGMNAYLSKPLKQADLAGAIREAFAQVWAPSKA